MVTANRRSVVITGASTGIGKACALHLAARGYTVFASVRRPTDGDLLQRESEGRVTPITIDVTDEMSISAACDALPDEIKQTGLFGLVNNAGITGLGPLELTPTEEVRAMIEVNLLGVIATTQAFLPLIRQGRGRIVNIGSLQGRLGMPYFATYSATKWALVGLSEALRLELRPWRIEVVMVEPGSIATPIWGKLFADWDTLQAGLPAAARELYGRYSEAMVKAVGDVSRRGVSPITVASIVERALTTRKPKTRYVVGRDARLLAALAAILPDRWRDALFIKMNGLPSSP